MSHTFPRNSTAETFALAFVWVGGLGKFAGASTVHILYVTYSMLHTQMNRQLKFFNFAKNYGFQIVGSTNPECDVKCHHI